MTLRHRSLRPARPGDTDAILAMIHALADYEKLSHLCSGTRADLDAALFGPAPAADVLLGEIDGKTAGFALFFPTFSTFLARRGMWLEDLFVYPEFRGHGLGRALLTGVARIAAERGCGRFEWSVLDWNVPSIRFYEYLGATVMPDWRIARVTGPALARLAASAEADPTGAG